MLRLHLKSPTFPTGNIADEIALVNILGFWCCFTLTLTVLQMNMKVTALGRIISYLCVVH